MAVGDTVFYRGEQWTVVSQAVVQSMEKDQQDEFTEVYALTRLEPAARESISRIAWVLASQCYLPLSWMHFQEADWFQGIKYARG